MRHLAPWHIPDAMRYLQTKLGATEIEVLDGAKLPKPVPDIVCMLNGKRTAIEVGFMKHGVENRTKELLDAGYEDVLNLPYDGPPWVGPWLWRDKPKV